MGSHGDVHPFIGIGLALLARGHRVRIVANPHFAPLIEKVGLGFIPVGTDEEYRELAKNPALWRRLEGTRIVMASLGRTIRPVYQAIAENNVEGQTLVVASSLALGARIAEDHLHIPTASVHLQPSILMSAITPPLLQGTFMPAWMPIWMRRLQISMIDHIADPMLAPSINTLRKELGLAPVRRILTNYIHSPRRVIGLFPEWFAPPQADWPSQVRLTGFPLYDERGTATLSDDLMKFLDAGDPPIAFTPGSAMWTGHRFFEESTRACQLLGRRGLLLTRHLEHLPQSLPTTVRHVAYAPFSELLPRCAAIVHHGGIGTSAQALAAGIPQLVTPHAHDQPDNAARLLRLGVAGKIEPNRYRGKNIAAELTKLINSGDVTIRCADVTAYFRGTNGIARTCDLIEDLVGDVVQKN